MASSSSSSSSLLSPAKSALPPRMPFPRSVRLCHAVPIAHSKALGKDLRTLSASTRPLHTCERLCRARLEATIQNNGEKNCTEEILLFNAVSDSTTPHLVWQNLHEKIDLTTICPTAYESLRFKIYLICPDNESEDFLMDVLAFPGYLARVGTVPEALPPNTICINYTDDSNRIQPSVYQKLVEKGLNDVIYREKPKQENLRFRDNIFDTLDQTPIAGRSRSISLIDDTYDSHQDGRKDNGESDSSLETHDLSLHRMNLEKKLQHLEDELTVQLNWHDSQKDLIPSQINLIENMKRQNDEIDRAITAEISENKRNIVQLRGRRTFLVQNLREIYPIATFENFATIRNARIPYDLFAKDVSDEDLAIALGYVAHVLVLLGKYLDTPLRYRLKLGGSRSYITGENEREYPLFGDRRRMDDLPKAMQYLNTTIDDLCQACGGVPDDDPLSASFHLIQKMKCIYDYFD